MRLTLVKVSVLVFAFVSSGCVTEVKSGFSAKFNREKAVTDSVAAAMAYIQEGQYQGAHRHLKRAYEFNPNSAQVLNAYALLYGVEGDRKRQEEHYRKAIRADKSFSKARNNYAAFLFSQERYPEAIEQLKIVVDDINYDRRFASFENLGRCYLKLGQREEAREAFFRSVRLNNQYHPSWLNLVEMSLQDKDFNAARSQLESYEKVGPATVSTLNLGLTIAKETGNDKMRQDYEKKLADLRQKRTNDTAAEKKPVSVEDSEAVSETFESFESS